MVKKIKLIRDNLEVSLIILLFIFVKLFFLVKSHVIIWDEAVYIGMGKYLFSFGKIGLFEDIRPVLLPMVFGFLWKLGLPIIFSGEILELFISGGVILMTYLIGKSVFNKWTGIIAAAILGLSPTFFLYSGYLLSGIPSTLLVLVAFYFFTRENYKLAGIFAGLSFLTRFPQGLILFVIGIAYVFDFLTGKRTKKRVKEYLANIFKIGFWFFITVLPFFIFNLFMYHKHTSTLFDAILRPLILASSHQSNPFESVSGFFPNLLFYVWNAISENGLLVFFLLGLILSFSKKSILDKNKRAIIILLLLYLSYLTYIINKQTRFLLMLLPVMAIFAAVGVLYTFFFLRKNKFFKSWYIKLPIFLLLSLFVLSSITASLQKHEDYYNWRPTSEPLVVDEYYRYFEYNPPSGAVLTTDPVPVAYSDALFIPYYYSLSEGRALYSEQILNEEIAYVIFNPSSLPCVSGDKECEKSKEEFTSEVLANQVIFEKEYYGSDYYILRK